MQLTFYVKVAFDYIRGIKLVIISRHFHIFKLTFQPEKVLIWRICKKVMMVTGMMQLPEA